MKTKEDIISEVSGVEKKHLNPRVVFTLREIKIMMELYLLEKNKK